MVAERGGSGGGESGGGESGGEGEWLRCRKGECC